MQRLSLEVFTDYHQFHVSDPECARDFGDWSDVDFAQRLVAGRYAVMVCTVRDMWAAVEIEVNDRDPGYMVADWDHIAECSFEAPSGRLENSSCTDGPVAELTVQPGYYRLRAHYGDLNSVDDSGLDGNDHYRVVLWPAPWDGVVVRKQWLP